MPAEKLEQFGGMLPAWDPHLLPAGQSPSSTNGYLFSGALGGWRVPKLLRQLQNSAAKFVYRIPTVSETPAQATLVTLANVLNGDTVTIGEDLYTFKTVIANAYDVLIGVDAPTSLNNLLAAITLDNGTSANQGTLYGTNTVRNPLVMIAGELKGYGNSVGTTLINGSTYAYMNVVAPDFGASFNTTNVSASRAIWLSNTAAITNTTSFFTGGTNPSFSQSITAPSTWLEFLDPYTNVVKSQVVDDQFQRYYFASPSQPPQYNTLARIQSGNTGPSAPFLLGINPPGCAPSVSVSGGGNNAQLGYTLSASNQNINVTGNTVILFPILPNANLVINDVSFMPNGTDTTVHFAALIYADQNTGGNVPSAPGQLLNTGAIETGIATGVLATSGFVNPTGLVQNTVYWIGIMLDKSELVNSGDNNSNTVTFFNTFSNGPPGIAPAPTTGQPNIQMFADLTTSDVVEARSYVYTWITAYGEESAPSPFTLVNGFSNGTWEVGVFSPPAADMGVNRNLAIIRLYRTVTATGGSTVFFFVADISLGSNDPDAVAFVAQDNNNYLRVGNTVEINQPCAPPGSVYTDVIPDSTIALGAQMPSTNFFPPPVNLEAIVSLPNGIFAGFKNNEVWFSEPYFPHAWPPGYVQTTDFPVVGLGITNGSLVACTQANAWVFTGVTPSQMSSLKCAPPDPCTSRGSIMSTDSGVFYISPNGLIQVTNAGVSTNTTELWITREKWAQLVPFEDTVAIPLASSYFCLGTTVDNTTVNAQRGFTIEMAQDAASFTIWPQPGGHRLGFQNLTAPLAGVNTDNLIIDPWTSYGMVIAQGNVYWYDFTDQSPTLTVYDWTSKIFQQNTKKSFEAFKVWFMVPPNTPALAPCRSELETDNPAWETLANDQYLIVLIYADIDDCAHDGQLQLVTAREVRKSGELLRILDGFKAEQWQFRLIGRVLVSNMQVATSAKELANV